MKERIHIATYSDNAVAVIKKYGVNIELNDICISEYLDDDKIDNAVEIMKQEVIDSGAASVIMHGPFTEISPSFIDHRAVELGFERLQEAYEACRKTGVNKMVVHSGFIPVLYYEDWHVEKSIPFWKEFMKDKPDDFNIYIENVFDQNPDVMRRIAEGTDDPRVGLCLDVGHAASFGRKYPVYQWIDTMAPYLRHFHIHNNDGLHDLHASLTDGVMDMKAVLAHIIEKCRDDVTFTIECRTCDEETRWLIETFSEMEKTKTKE